MGRNNRRRRLDKQRRANERRRRQGASSPPSAARHRAVDPPPIGPQTSDRRPNDPAAPAAGDRLEQIFGLVLREHTWPRGWQPDELLRHIRGRSSRAAAAVVAMAIAADVARHHRVGNVIHEAWRLQTEDIVAGCLHEPARDGWLGRWLDAGGDDVDLATVRTVLDTLVGLPTLPTLIAPPGSVGGVVEVPVPSNPKLATIRGLLAKAESTDFPAEAETFTAKAQAMMIEARLDDATVRSRQGQATAARVSAIRVAIVRPYIASKRALLHVVAAANDVRCVFHRGTELATLVGPVGQLAHVELLFTSLLIQVEAALAADARGVAAGSHRRSRSYRSSFILGYARRVGQRLQAARQASLDRAATDALPVLAVDDRATAELFDRLVGRTTVLRSSGWSDAVGAAAGALAADRASLRESGLERPAADPPPGLRPAG